MFVIITITIGGVRMENNNKIGERIKKIRTDKGLTLQELGEKVGLSHASLSKYESGDVSNIPITRIYDISRALQVEPSSLMGWNDEESSQEKLIKRLIELTENNTIHWEFINEPNKYFTNINKDKTPDYDIKPLIKIEEDFQLVDCYIYNYDKGFYYIATQGKFLDLGIDYKTGEDTEIYDYSTHLYASNKKYIIDLFQNSTVDLINKLYKTIKKSNNNPENEVINDLLNDLEKLNDEN